MPVPLPRKNMDAHTNGVHRNLVRMTHLLIGPASLNIAHKARAWQNCQAGADSSPGIEMELNAGDQVLRDAAGSLQ